MSEFHQCGGVDCPNNGRFICKRCGLTRFCSSSCQRSSWQEHKKTCRPTENYVGTKPYIWDPPDCLTRGGAPWLMSEMKEAPDQEMDPPDTEDYEFLNQFWRYVI